MNKVTVLIPNISCGHCVHTIQNELGELEGVLSVSADQVTKRVTISYDSPTTEEKIKKLLLEINYPAQD